MKTCFHLILALAVCVFLFGCTRSSHLSDYEIAFSADQHFPPLDRKESVRSV